MGHIEKQSTHETKKWPARSSGQDSRSYPLIKTHGKENHKPWGSSHTGHQKAPEVRRIDALIDRGICRAKECWFLRGKCSHKGGRSQDQRKDKWQIGRTRKTAGYSWSLTAKADGNNKKRKDIKKIALHLIHNSSYRLYYVFFLFFTMSFQVKHYYSLLTIYNNMFIDHFVLGVLHGEINP